MTNRTVQFWGQGYSAPAEGLAFTPCNITATVDGNQVFSGSVPTVEGTDIARLPSDQQILFTFEIPLVSGNTSYTLPVSLDITGDDIYLEQILINYCGQTGNTSSGPTGFGITTGGTDPRANVVVTGASYVNPPPSEPRDPATLGTWGWEIECATGTTANMTFDMIINPGRE
jgi:hypothetical protein